MYAALARSHRPSRHGEETRTTGIERWRHRRGAGHVESSPGGADAVHGRLREEFTTPGECRLPKPTNRSQQPPIVAGTTITCLLSHETSMPASQRECAGVFGLVDHPSTIGRTAESDIRARAARRSAGINADSEGQDALHQGPRTGRIHSHRPYDYESCTRLSTAANRGGSRTRKSWNSQIHPLDQCGHRFVHGLEGVVEDDQLRDVGRALRRPEQNVPGAAKQTGACREPATLRSRAQRRTTSCSSASVEIAIEESTARRSTFQAMTENPMTRARTVIVSRIARQRAHSRAVETQCAPAAIAIARKARRKRSTSCRWPNDALPSIGN
jgi:hypothetical protein